MTKEAPRPYTPETREVPLEDCMHPDLYYLWSNIKPLFWLLVFATLFIVAMGVWGWAAHNLTYEYVKELLP
jgi:hypothetical protein